MTGTKRRPVGRTPVRRRQGGRRIPVAGGSQAVRSVAAQSARYGGENVFFATKRKDWRYDLNAGVAYKPARQWTVSTQLLYTRSDSNIEINDFDRKQFLVTVRRDFF